MLRVAVYAWDQEQRQRLSELVTETGEANLVSSLIGPLPGGVDELEAVLIREDCQILLVDIRPQNPAPAFSLMGLLHTDMPEVAIFAVGETNQGQVVVSAMKAGACEYLGTPCTTAAIREAFARRTSPKSTISSYDEPTGRLITVVNAKGGCGATTVAVNLAIALQEEHGSTVLVDFAPIGNTTCHLNIKPRYYITDALSKLQRLDEAMLEALLTPGPNGLQVLAGPLAPSNYDSSCEHLPVLFNLLRNMFKYVVVDASSRLDSVSRTLCEISTTVLLVSEVDVVGLLWGASRVLDFLGTSSQNGKVKLVLNRCSKNSAYSDSDAEAAVDAKLICKIPSDGNRVGAAINSGTPVVLQRKSEIARAFVSLAASVARGSAR